MTVSVFAMRKWSNPAGATSSARAMTAAASRASM
jgi:hypothetical protein